MIAYGLLFMFLPVGTGSIVWWLGLGGVAAMETVIASIPLIISMVARVAVKGNHLAFMSASLWPRMGVLGVWLLGRLLEVNRWTLGDLVLFEASYISFRAAAAYHLLWLAMAGALMGFFCGMGLVGGASHDKNRPRN